MKKRKLLLIVLSIFFILATIIFLTPKKGSYADFGDFSGSSDYGSSSSSNNDDGGSIILAPLYFILGLIDFFSLIIEYPLISFIIIHTILVIISILKVNEKCIKNKKPIYFFLSLLFPIITLIIIRKTKPNKYEPISTYFPEEPESTENLHIARITAKDRKNNKRNQIKK